MRSSASPGSNRCCDTTVMTTPAARAAPMSRSAAARVVSIGFSMTRCLPAAAACVPTSAWRPLGTHTDTTSISARARSADRSASAAQPCISAKARALSGTTSVTATSRAAGSIAIASACIAAITPAPTIPNPCRRVLPPGPVGSLLNLHPGGEQLQVLGNAEPGEPRRRRLGTRRGLVRHALTLRFFRATASPPRPARPAHTWVPRPNGWSVCQVGKQVQARGAYHALAGEFQPVKSGGELFIAGRFSMLYLVHGLAQPGQLPVHLPPRTVGVSQRLVLGQAVPRVITQHIREGELLVGVETLRGKPEPGHRDIGGHALRPLDRSV